MAKTTETAPQRKRVGRPRRIPQATNKDPRDEILSVAGRLFTKFGFVNTSTRQIADEVGMQQGALFHYFGRKIDILFALLDMVHEPPTRRMAQLEEINVSPAAKIYLLSSTDARNLASVPNNIGLLFLHADVTSLPEFRIYEEKRNNLRETFVGLIRAGVEVGQFRSNLNHLAADVAFGTVEAVSTWRSKDASHDPADVGRSVGTSILFMLMEESSIDHVLSEAADAEKVLDA